MYFMALAADYDGTLADHGEVSNETIEALIRFKASGRKLIMVTGRRLDDLKQIFDRLDLFDSVVAENGALVYIPQTETQHLLSEPPSENFLINLKNKQVTPLFVGKVIVATEQPQEQKVLDVIRDLGLGVEIIFNKNAVMILPNGINKTSGLAFALKELQISMHNVIGIGDAENDHSFLRTVGLNVAVANAIDAIKEGADFVTRAPSGQGVAELINQLLQDEDVLVLKIRRKIKIGSVENQVDLIPLDYILIAGSSGIGKSTLATALTEKMVENGFQFCLFDPEGDYEKLENAIGVGDVKFPPSNEQVLEILQDPSRNVVVNTLGIQIKDRPSFFIELAPILESLKSSKGHPHWFIIDEAHYLIPAAQENRALALPKGGVILITVHPEKLSIDCLKGLNIIIILGIKGYDQLKQLSKIIGEDLPEFSDELSDDEILVWQRTPQSIIKKIKTDHPKQQHKRHTRKYAEGDLSEEFCFYFTGPDNKLHLKAQNLIIFLQIAEGIDDDTWIYHLKRGDYSDWFRVHIKDTKLADAAKQIETNNSLSATESRKAIKNLVQELYTAPASEKIKI